MVDGGDGATRRVRAPDLDGQIISATEPVEELLLMIAACADDDPDGIPPQLHPAAAAEAAGELPVASLHANYGFDE